MGLEEVRVAAQPLERFGPFVDSGRFEEALHASRRWRERLARRVFWNVNSTAVGGGVAEMLQPLLGYARGMGVDARWVVIRGKPDFFAVTKQVHHALHGSLGSGPALDAEARRVYEGVLRENALELRPLLRPGDVVLLHDPQTAGLAPHLEESGAHVLWRCHIGCETANEVSREGWRFLEPYLAEVPHFVFTRQAYVPDFCDHGKTVIITPSIDAFSAKNQDLSQDVIRTILVHTGLVEGPPPANADLRFVRDDGTPGRVERRADVVRLGRPPGWETPLVVQVSRWDPLKDMAGVMRGFAQMLRAGHGSDAHLVLAGPNVSGVSDDPEGAAVFEQVVAEWRSLGEGIRQRVDLVCLPTQDVQENAAIVNALQRHAVLVVQKSLQEGFGLTVTEAMWKGRAVLASAVGGIQDQIEHGVSGVLLKDPADIATFAEALGGLLEDAAARERLGGAARERVRTEFLGVDHLLKYAALLERVVID